MLRSYVLACLVYVYKYIYVYSPAVEAAAPTVFMVWLRAWRRAKNTVSHCTVENQDKSQYMLVGLQISSQMPVKVLSISNVSIVYTRPNSRQELRLWHLLFQTLGQIL
jgi:hypothetical protein